MHGIRRHTQLYKCIGYRTDHGVRATYPGLINGHTTAESLEQLRHLVPVDASTRNLELLLLLAEYEVHLQAFGKAIL